MELSVQDWLIGIGALLIVGVLLDAYRRYRSERRNTVRISRSVFGMGGGFARDDAELPNAELPSGGARVRSRLDGSLILDHESDSDDDEASFEPSSSSAAERIEPTLGSLSEPSVDRMTSARAAQETQPAKAAQAVQTAKAGQAGQAAKATQTALQDNQPEPSVISTPANRIDCLSADIDPPPAPETASELQSSKVSGAVDPGVADENVLDGAPGEDEADAGDQLADAISEPAPPSEDIGPDVSPPRLLPEDASAETLGVAAPVSPSDAQPPAASANADDGILSGVRVRTRAKVEPEVAPGDNHWLFGEDELRAVRETPAVKDKIKKSAARAATGAEAAAPQEVLVLHVVARHGGQFEGEVLRRIFEACDVRHGEMNIFHRHEQADGQGPVQFSIANAVEPGSFDLKTMDSMLTPGLSFFMQLPGPQNPLDAFNAMFETARVIVRHLDGEMLDETRSVFTQQTAEHCRERIRAHRQRSRIVR